MTSRVARFISLKLTETGKIYQITIKYTKKSKNVDRLPSNRPNGHQIYPPKFTQILIFGLKTNHLATEMSSRLALKKHFCVYENILMSFNLDDSGLKIRRLWPTSICIICRQLYVVCMLVEEMICLACFPQFRNNPSFMPVTY
jgi:hypothetical protein